MEQNTLDLFTLYIKTRIKKNKNFLCAITGPTGSGKTYSSLALAEKLDSNFNSNRVVFTPQEFIDLLNNGDLETGSVIVFDEAGVSLNNREWHSKSNNLIQYILQTFRHKNYIVIFTSPDFAFIDKASRKLFHCYIETQGINFKEKLCNLKPLMIQINQRDGSMFYKYLVVKMEGLGKAKIQSIKMPLPDKNLIKEYEIKKTEFTSKLNNKIEEEFKEEKNVKIPKEQMRLYKLVRGMRQMGLTWFEISEGLEEKSNAIQKWYRNFEVENKKYL